MKVVLAMHGTGGKGRGKPKSKGQIQKRLAQHQKATGSTAHNQAAAGRPATAAAPRPQTASPLAIKAAELQGLRLCLMMVILERARKTAVRPLPSLTSVVDMLVAILVACFLQGCLNCGTSPRSSCKAH